jgi:hypothetical protein
VYDEEHPESRRRNAGAAQAHESPFDYAFAGFVAALKDTLRQRILAAYERPFAVIVYCRINDRSLGCIC